MYNELQTPLPLVRQWTDMIPNLWEDFVNLTDRNRQSDDHRTAEEPELLAALSIVERWTPPDTTSSAEIAHAAFDLYCCAIWRQHKVVYAFDETLAEELVRQADDWSDTSALPIEALKRPPYRCCFLSAPGLLAPNFIGFFPSIVHELAGDGYVLTLTSIYDEADGPAAHVELLSLSGSTVGDCIASTMRSARRAAAKAGGTAQIDRVTILRLLNLYLYVCADNAEIDHTPAPTYRPRQVGSPIRDKFREVQTFPTGIVIGSALRKAASAQRSGTSSGEPTGRHVRAHTRRGHWYHFWIGRRTSPEERKIILRWVAPTLVGGKDDPEITTIHRVK